MSHRAHLERRLAERAPGIHRGDLFRAATVHELRHRGQRISLHQIRGRWLWVVWRGREPLTVLPPDLAGNHLTGHLRKHAPEIFERIYHED